MQFTKALDLSFDGASIFGGDRSKRYALVIEDGKVKEAHVEPDNTGLNGMAPTTVFEASDHHPDLDIVSAAEKVL